MPVGLKIAIIIVIVLGALWLAFGYLFFHIALGSKKRKDNTIPCKGSLFEKNANRPAIIAGYKWYDKTYHQYVTVKNRDGVTLHAAEFRNPSNSNTWAIVLHGWTNVHREMSSYAMEYYRRGFNVLLPDLRGHGASESKYVTMGWLDRLDVVDWIKSIVAENPHASIILHGVSMGSATVMMTTGEKLPGNVLCAVADCGFCDVTGIFTDQCIRKYHVPPKLALPVASLWCKLLNGFFFSEASAVTQLRKSETPTFFIHGDKDDFVLVENLDKVYNACVAPCSKYIVHGAEHAVSSHWFHEEYWSKVDAFINRYVTASQNAF